MILVELRYGINTLYIVDFAPPVDLCGRQFKTKKD